LVLALSIFVSSAFGQSVEVANDYYEHGLHDKAKDMLLTAIHSPSTIPASKARALYLLGQISFDEGQIKVAVSDWKTLIKDYPQTSEAKEIGDRLQQLTEVLSKELDTHVNSAVAGSYISNGDFWTDKGDRFTIDSSYLDETELATFWYDRVIHEFPGSDDAELAYRKKLFAIIGYREPGEYGSSWGAKGNYKLYMPVLLSAFAEMEAAFPKSSSLQGFRYQIAQLYWVNSDKANAKIWLQKVIDNEAGVQSFFTETAKARLENLR
jgi:tetratricopeptide (TPR) repeat protein